MKLYPSPQCCGADITAETTVQEVRRGRPPRKKQAKQIHHYRASDGARWWHWSDQKVIQI